MKLRHVIIVLILLVATTSVGLAIFIHRLPDNEEEEFTYYTGIPYPTGAACVESATRTWRSGFKTERYRKFHIRTEPAIVQEWVRQTPPFSDRWSFEEIPTGVNGDYPNRRFQISQKGDLGRGIMLAVDPATGEAIFLQWRW